MISSVFEINVRIYVRRYLVMYTLIDLCLSGSLPGSGQVLQRGLSLVLTGTRRDFMKTGVRLCQRNRSTIFPSHF